MFNDDVISMPDKWEYPWYAAWDLAFHTLPLSVVDLDFAKQQLDSHPARPLSSSQRPGPSIRMEFQRRKPSRPRLGHSIPASHPIGLRVRPISSSSRHFQQALAELHLVGESERQVREECVRWRISRTRQHRRVRPQRSAAHRRLSRAGGRHLMDGSLHAEHGRDRGGTRRSRSHLRGYGLSSSPSTSVYYRRGNEPPRTRRHVGRRGRLLLRPVAASRRQCRAAEGAVHGGVASALCALRWWKNGRRERFPAQ